MDLWLALFSDPQKEHFAPEFSLQGGSLKGMMNVADDIIPEDDEALSSKYGRAQMWLTNLVSSTTGVRTLNIDFGAEGYVRESGAYLPLSTRSTGLDRGLLMRHYTANFRVFGKNIQDSSLVLKVGQYNAVNSIVVRDSLSQSRKKSQSGMTYGGELQLYISRWLGLEGNYQVYGDKTHFSGENVQGTYYDAMAYLEISLLRFMAGYYDESWNFRYPEDNYLVKTHEKGTIIGLKVQIQPPFSLYLLEEEGRELQVGLSPV